MVQEIAAVSTLRAEAVAPESTGGVRSLLTVTVTAAEAVFPAASRATAVRAYKPFPTVAVFQERLYGATVSSGPRLTSSSLNWTLATPTLSAAVAETVMVPETELFAAGVVMETAGGVVSGGGAVVNTASGETARLPAASLDFTR